MAGLQDWMAQEVQPRKVSEAEIHAALKQVFSTPQDDVAGFAALVGVYRQAKKGTKKPGGKGGRGY